MDIQSYIESVLAKGTLNDEILRIQHLLVGLHKHPCPDKDVQTRKVQLMTQVFKALLAAKEAR